jgi:predicted transcriptional regulator
MSLAIKLTAEQERRLGEIAQRLSVSPSTLAEAAVRELVAQPEADFDRISRRILEKNRELYERLR